MTRFSPGVTKGIAATAAALLIAVVFGGSAGCQATGKQVYVDDYREMAPYTTSPVLESKKASQRTRSDAP